MCKLPVTDEGVEMLDLNKRVLQVVDPDEVGQPFSKIDTLKEAARLTDSEFFTKFYPNNEWVFVDLFKHYQLREGSIFESRNSLGDVHKYKLIGVVDEANPVHLYDLNDTKHPDTFVSPQWFNYRTLNTIQY